MVNPTRLDPTLQMENTKFMLTETWNWRRLLKGTKKTVSGHHITAVAGLDLFKHTKMEKQMEKGLTTTKME